MKWAIAGAALVLVLTPAAYALWRGKGEPCLRVVYPSGPPNVRIEATAIPC